MRQSAPKGMQDITPPDIYIWQEIESSMFRVFKKYGFQEIRTPIVESTDIFLRSIGNSSDIVEKEMYTFIDKGGRSLSLRPEGTASVVRCYIENSLYNLPAPQKFFYNGPMFRYERPQKGRFRQFHQIAVESFGINSPLMDAEIILMLKDFLEQLRLNNLNFEINSIGCGDCRQRYKDILADFLRDKLSILCFDCQRRYNINSLRILDCKVDKCIEIRKGAPQIIDYICLKCRSHFDKMIGFLERQKVSFILNPNLVRGLDYYTKTIFEVTSIHLGSQNAIAAGGRYDNLVKDLGGPDTGAIGFGIGIERLITLLKEKKNIQLQSPDIFIAIIGSNVEEIGFEISQRLRNLGYWIEMSYKSSSLKNQLSKAYKINSKNVLILGDDELIEGEALLKNLKDGSQKKINIKNIDNIKI